jgi:hypothetical protein
MKSRDIELHVEELVLHGFEPGDRYGIGQAVEQELGRLLAELGTPPSLARTGEVPHLDGGSFETKPGSGVEAIGAQVARAVYGGLSS